MEHLLFIVNPISGDTPKARLKALISFACNKNKKEYSVFNTTGENDRQKILARIKATKPSRLIACGGDGTVNLAAEMAMNFDLPLGIVPLGSANGLATTLRIPKNIKESLEVCFRGRIIGIDAVCINEVFFSFHLSDLGFNAKMIEDFEKNGERGMMAYAKSFFKSLATKSTTDYIIYVNSEKISVSADMIVIANASKYGTGAVISPGSRVDDGSFELVIFKPIPLSALLGLTLESFLGDLRNSPYVEIHTATKADIICGETVLFQVDGELVGGTTSVKAEIRPKSVRVMVPAI